MRSSLLAVALLPLAAGCTQQPLEPGPPAFPAKLQALGTEPFWSIEIDGGDIAWSSADEPDKRKARVARSEAGGALTLQGTLTGKPITVTIAPESCSDGMSDRTYPYSAKVRWGERSLEGCARRPGEAQPPA